jgi:hypothetical protein
MKKILQGLLGFFIVSVFVIFLYIEVVTEATVARWETRVQSVERLETTNLQIQQSQQYSQTLMYTVSELATQNSIMCDRELGIQLVVVGFEEENRRLTFSLSDSVERLESQQVEINELIDEHGRLRYKIEVLELALQAVAAAEEDECDVEKLDVDGPE